MCTLMDLNLDFWVMLHQEIEPLTTLPAHQLIIGQLVPSIRIFSERSQLGVSYSA